MINKVEDSQRKSSNKAPVVVQCRLMGFLLLSWTVDWNKNNQTCTPVDLHLSKAPFSLDPDNLQLHCFLGLGTFCRSFFCPLDRYQPCNTLQMAQVAPCTVLYSGLVHTTRNTFFLEKLDAHISVHFGLVPPLKQIIIENAYYFHLKRIQPQTFPRVDMHI